MPDKGALVILPAAGAGRRLGENKAMARLLGKPLLLWTIEALSASLNVAEIYPVIKDEDLGEVEAMVQGLKQVGGIIKGGPERQDSVLNALMELKGRTEPNRIVLVHDGARPLVSPDIIERCIKGLDGHEGAVAAVPPNDTVKRVDDTGVAVATLERGMLRLVQTPQCFRFGTLLEAYESAAQDGVTATDDSALVERLGGRVKMVMGSYRNIKITTAEDIPVAEAHLKRRGN